MSSDPSTPSALPAGQAPIKFYDGRVDWLIVVMKKGDPVVYIVELHDRMTGVTTLHAVRKAYQESKPSTPWYHSRPKLEDATISSFTTNADPEAQDYPRAVIIKSSEPLPELTMAFHNPTLLHGTGNALLRDNEHMNVARGLNKTDGHYHAILVKTEASRWLIAAAVLGSIILSAAFGFVVGYLTKNADLGVAAGSAAIAVLAFIQACLVYLK